MLRNWHAEAELTDPLTDPLTGSLTGSLACPLNLFVIFSSTLSILCNECDYAKAGVSWAVENLCYESKDVYFQ